jgi:hypothetical protein
MLETLSGSKLRIKVLVWLFSHTNERYFVRQLAGMVHEDSTNVSRELSRLEKSGILISTIEGKRKYYQSNRQSPVFNELKNLIAVMPLPISEPSNGEKAANIDARFPVTQSQLAAFCREHHIKKLSLFGSVLRNNFRPDSDVDVLVEFEPGKVPGFGIIKIQNELTQLVGRHVDLRTPGDLSRYFRSDVVKEARVKYVSK